MQALSIIRNLMQAAGNQKIHVAVCSTSYPREFHGLSSELIRYPILERELVNLVEKELGSGVVNLLYSDYASARTRSDEDGGPGYPRIDYPIQTEWLSNRQKIPPKDKGTYIDAAKKIMSQNEWNDELRIYGANMIRDAANGKVKDRQSASFWVSVRINLHLHRQAHYNSADEIFLGDESSWQD
jgi:hypothetical protein